MIPTTSGNDALDRHDRRRARVLRTVTLIGLLLVVMTGAAWTAGVKPLVFTSGSMAPTISTGSLALAQTVDPATLDPGDVVSVANGSGDRVTHRVVAADPHGSSTALLLRGDANVANDPEPYVVAQADRVLFSVPAAGRVVAHLDGVAGLVLIGVTVLGVTLVVRRAGGTHRRARASSGTPIVALSVSSLLVCGAVVASAAPTAAYWTDTAIARSGTITAAGPTPTPANGQCAVAGNNVNTSWTSVGQRYRYQLTLHRFDNGVQVGAAVLVPAVSTATAAAQVTPTTFSPSAVAATGQFNFVVRVRALPSASTTWLSTAFLGIPIRYTADRGALLCGTDDNTFVTIASLGQDSGSSNTDFVTNVAANTVNGTGEPGATISVRRGGAQIGTATVNSLGNWSAVVALGAEGQFAISAVATDLSGNTATASQNIWLDVTAPGVPGLASPCLNADGSSAVGNPVAGLAGANWCKLTSRPFNATYPTSAVDAGPSTTTGLQYTDNGSAWTNFPSTDGFQTGSYTMLESARRDMQARAVDLAGNIGPVRAVTYYIDGTAPTVNVTSPAQVNYSSVTALRNAVSAACGATTRVACGTIDDTISGPSTAVAPSWQLRRRYVVLGLFETINYLASNGSYQSGPVTSAATLVPGGFRIAVPTTSTTFYPSAGAIESGSSYILTISGAQDAAGNSAGPFVRTFSD